jgi:hypothetical protein
VLQDSKKFAESYEVLEMAGQCTPDHCYNNIMVLWANESFIHAQALEAADLVNINYKELNEIEQYI